MTQIYSSQRLVCLVSVLALLAGASPVAAMPVEHIISPRPAGWSVDYTGSISPETRQEIDHLGERIHEASGAELIVVVIESTGGEPVRDFAVRLFNHWGLDESAQGKGILLFAALGDRSAELVLGRELETPGNHQRSEAIMQGEMVPRFRAGDPGGALLEGARACSRLILALDVAPLPAETATPMPPLATSPETSPSYVAPEPARSGPSLPGGLFLGTVIGLGLIGGGYFLMRAPRCGQCRVPMILMAEEEDDAHLTQVEKTEERIGSVDHEIWVCQQCGETRKKSSSGLFSGYSHCSSCGAKAVQSTSWVIENPTYTSTGTRRVDTACAHCAHRTSYTVAIPRLEERRYDTSSGSSSRRSSSHSSSSGSSSWSSSSSSSSSSRSSGSGPSSRGGASGRW